PSTSQPNVSEPQTELLQTETPPTVSHEPQTEANIEQILLSPSIYQRKHSKTQKHRRAKKVTELPQTSVSLDLGVDEDVHKEGVTTRSERVLKQPNEPPLPEGHTSGSEEGRMAHTFELMDIVPPTPHDSPLLGGYTPGSDEGRLTLEELMAMCTKLSKQVLDLEKEKDAQAVEILKLKKRVKKLERQRKPSISHPRRRIYRQVESSNDDLDEEDASKQGRKVTRQSQCLKIEVVTQKQLISDGKESSIERSSRPIRSITTLQPLPTINPKDKAKELDEELRVERERQEEASKVAIAEMFDEKQLVAERAEAIRNKPPTKTQLRNLMMTYLKNMGGYNHSQLKGKSYEEIQGFYERQQKRIQDFTPIDSEKETQKPGKRLKRVVGSYATQKSPKKPKVMKSAKDVTEEEAAEYEKEKEELRADGSSSYYGDTQAFLRRLDRKDLNNLYRLVQERFQDHPLEGHDLLVWGDLRMIFDPDEKGGLWMNELDWKLLRWKLYENYGVHTLFMDGKPMEINMIVEKKYPLIKELLEKMLTLQLENEEESTMAFELIKFIKSLLEE
ncbi:hypothetical protein Tco_1307091, partial [Tanacetum coccineum]